jgi:hypothetical protein
LQGERSSLCGSGFGLAQRGRNLRPRSVHFVAPRAPDVEANRPPVRSVPRVPPVGDPFSAPGRLAPFSVGVPGGPGERSSAGPVARLARGRDGSFGVTAGPSRPARRGPAEGASMSKPPKREAPGCRPAFRGHAEVESSLRSVPPPGDGIHLRDRCCGRCCWRSLALE